MRLIDHEYPSKVEVNLDEYKRDILRQSPKSRRYLKNGEENGAVNPGSLQRTDSDSSDNMRKSPTAGYSRYFKAIRGHQTLMKEVSFDFENASQKNANVQRIRRSESVKPLGHNWWKENDKLWQTVSLEDENPPPVPPRVRKAALPPPERPSLIPTFPPVPPPKPKLLPAPIQLKKATVIETQVRRNRPPSINPMQTMKNEVIPDHLKPSVQEYEQHRRLALKNNIARAERLKGPWNVADYTSDTDNLSPKDKMNAIRTNYSSDDYQELHDGRYHSLVLYRKKRFQKGSPRSEDQTPAAEESQEFHWWPGQRTQLGSTDASRVRQVWEQRIQQHQDWHTEEQGKPHHQFKKWKSLDALSASLVKKEGQHLVPSGLKPGERPSQIPGREPRDKPDPLFRLPVNYLERDPEQPPLYKHMATAAMSQNTVNPQWFDPGRIKDAVSHESIANLGATKSRWEQRVEDASNYNASNEVRGNTPISAQYYGRAMQDISLQREAHEQRQLEIHSNTTLSWQPQMMSPGADHHKESSRAVRFDSEDVAQVSDSDMEREKQLFLNYLNCRPDVLQSLGMMVPFPMRQRVMAIGPQGPKVILQQVPGHAGQTAWYQTYGSTHDGGQGISHGGYGSRAIGRAHSPASNGYGSTGSQSNSRQSTLERGRGGRYIKNAALSSSVPRPMTKAQNAPSGKRTWARVEPVTPPPLNRRSEHEEGENKGTGENMIAREIRDLKEREEDLKRSRSELGLPNLEDVFEMWKEKGGDEQGMRSAKSVDHLHLTQHDDGSLLNMGLGNMPFRAGSLDHLHQAHLNTPSYHHTPPSPVPDRKMHNQSPLDYTPHKRTPLPPPKADARENGYHPPQSSSSPHPRVAKDIEFALAREESLRRARTNTPRLSVKGLGPSAKYLSNVAEMSEMERKNIEMSNDDDQPLKRNGPPVPNKPNQGPHGLGDSMGQPESPWQKDSIEYESQDNTYSIQQRATMWQKDSNGQGSQGSGENKTPKRGLWSRESSAQEGAQDNGDSWGQPEDTWQRGSMDRGLQRQQKSVSNGGQWSRGSSSDQASNADHWQRNQPETENPGQEESLVQGSPWHRNQIGMGIQGNEDSHSNGVHRPGIGQKSQVFNGQRQSLGPSPTGSAGRKSPYEKFLDQHHPSKINTQDLPYNENRIKNDHVPMETRIEREVAQLQKREAELKTQRASNGVHYEPIALQVQQDGESDGGSAGSGEQVRTREYIGQRNPGFNPVYSDDAFSPVKSDEMDDFPTPSTSLLRSPYSDNEEVHISDTEPSMIQPNPGALTEKLLQFDQE